MRKAKKDLLNKCIGAGFTASDKEAIKNIKRWYGVSYAQLVRNAMHSHYSIFFEKGQ